MYSVDKLKKNFQLKENEKMNIYLTGSRVYGTHSESSDFDFYIIISDDYFKILKDSKIPNWNYDLKLDYQCLYHEDSNINLYSYSCFFEKVEENWLQSLMCLYLPKEFILQEDFKFQPKIYYRRLGKSVIGEAGKHFEMARRKWNKNSIYSCKKYIIHSIRDFLFGIQIVKKKEIVNYREANDFYYEILKLKLEDWKDYEEIYHPIYQKLKDEFEKIILFSDEKMSLLKFLSDHELDDLRLYFSLKIEKDEKLELYHISIMNESPLNYNIVKECNGVILDNNMCIICHPMPYLFPFNHHNVPRINWNNCTVILDEDYEYINFFYHKEILLSKSNCIIHGEEKQNILNLFEKNKFLFPKEKDLTFVFLRKNELFWIYSIVDMNGKENKIEKYIEKYQWKSKEIIFENVKNIDYLYLESNSLDPLKYKGYIVQDSNFNRFRIESSQFTSLKSLMNNEYSDFYYLDILRLGIDIQMKNNNMDKFENIFDHIYEKIENFYQKNLTLEPKIFTKNLKEFVEEFPTSFQLDLGKLLSKGKKLGYKSFKILLKHVNVKELKNIFFSKNGW